MKNRLNKKFDKNKNEVDYRLDFIAKVCAIVLPFTTLDQLYLIYIRKQTEGLSATTWFLYGVFTIPLFIYSLKRRDIPIIILNGLWLFFDFTVWFGVLIY